MGMFIYYGIGAAVFFAAFAMLFREGLWSNTITLINVVVSGFVAFGYFELFNELLLDQFGKEYVYVFPLVSIWAIFAVTFIVLQRLFTGLLSRTRMRFVPQLDSFGGGFVALLIALSLVGFSFSTLHAAPLPVDMAGGQFDYDFDGASATKPDVTWLNLTELALDPDRWGAGSNKKFVAASYVKHYKDQRAELEKQQGLLKK